MHFSTLTRESCNMWQLIENTQLLHFQRIRHNGVFSPKWHVYVIYIPSKLKFLHGRGGGKIKVIVSGKLQETVFSRHKRAVAHISSH